MEKTLKLGRNDFKLGRNDLGRNGLGAKRPVSCSNLIGQFCHLSIQHGGGGVLFCKVCVGALHIEIFRETKKEVIVSLLEEKDVLVSQPTASEKYVIFIPSRSYASPMLRR